MSEKLRTALKQLIDMKMSCTLKYRSLVDRLQRIGKFNASAKLREIASEEAEHAETFEKILSGLSEKS